MGAEGAAPPEGKVNPAEGGCFASLIEYRYDSDKNYARFLAKHTSLQTRSCFTTSKTQNKTNTLTV